HVPQSSNPDFYALQVLDSILFFGESSRLYQRLVDKDEIALSVNSYMGLAIDPTLYVMSVQPKANIAPEAVEKALYEELDKLKTSDVTATELQKAKNVLVANFYRQMKTINGKANTLGSYEVFFGDYRKLFTAADEYAKVTAADVKRVAQK
ncbi:MAG TPA: insulinase family protein, partial [Blastocatellia bacterium]|nr:insulinase family protein [Blastocatellia bacterium]